MSIALQLQWCGHALITAPWWPSAHSQRSLYHDLSVAERPKGTLQERQGSCNAGIYTPHPHAQMATKKMIPSLPETSHFRNVVFQKHHVLKT